MHALNPRPLFPLKLTCPEASFALEISFSVHLDHLFLWLSRIEEEILIAVMVDDSPLSQSASAPQCREQTPFLLSLIRFSDRMRMFSLTIQTALSAQTYGC
jgi:hypothetical protein